MKHTLYYTVTPNDSCAYYRINPLKRISHCAGLNRIPQWYDFPQTKNFVIQRPAENAELNMMLVAKNYGVKVIVDYDDDLLNWDDYNPAKGYYDNKAENIKECLKVADEVWVSTQAIKDVYSLYNKNIHVIPNAYMWGEPEKPNLLNRKVLWRGSPTHEVDMLLYPYEKLVKGNEKWQFYTMGWEYTYYKLTLGDNYNWLGVVPITNFFEMIKEINPNVMMFPLVDTQFNRGKSNIAWLEATSIGAATFASMLPEYQKPGVTDIKMLHAACEGDKVKFMRDRWEESWEYIKENLLVDKVNKLREERLCTD